MRGRPPRRARRELTKLHEETRRGTLGELADDVEDQGVRGELTLVVGGAPAPAVDAAELGTADLAAMVAALEADGTPRKQAIAGVARDLGLPKRQVYAAVVEHKDDRT